LATGIKPRKNIDVMKEVFNKILNTPKEDEALLKKKTKKKKSKVEEEVNVEEEVQIEEEKPKKKKKAKVEA